MIDYKALAERLEEATYGSYLTSQEAADLRALTQLARERAEAPEPVGYMRPDELAQAKDAPRMCRVHPAKDRQADMVPVFTYPPAAQPQREPTYLDPTAVALGLAWSEDGQADSVEPTEYIYIRLKRPEGYEDVHPDLVLEDAHINPAFEAEVVSEPTEAQSTIAERRLRHALDGLDHGIVANDVREVLDELAVLRAALAAKESK